MIRNFAIALNIFNAGRNLGKYARQQIIGASAQDLRRDFLSLAETVTVANSALPPRSSEI